MENITPKISMGTGAEYVLMEGDLSFERYIGYMAFQYGALIAYRDERHNGTLPDKESFYKQNDAFGESYSQGCLQKLQKELSELQAMSEEEKVQYGLDSIEKNIQANTIYLQEYSLGLERLDHMLHFVSSWNPEPEYADIRNRAMENLQRCINSQQSSIDYCLQDTEKWQNKTAITVFEEHLSNVLKEIAYYNNNDSDNTFRVEERWKWVEGLQQSLRNHAQSIQKKQQS